jgi:hypothetical protein
VKYLIIDGDGPYLPQARTVATKNSFHDAFKSVMASSPQTCEWAAPGSLVENASHGLLHVGIVRCLAWPRYGRRGMRDRLDD